MFFCEFCKISKNAFSYITPPVAASEVYEKNSFTYSFSCILLSFSKNALKVCEQNFFHDYKQKVVRDVIFCSITIHFEFGIWRCFWWSWVLFFSKKIGIYCNTKITKHSFFLSLCVLICTFDKRLIALHHGEFVLKSVSNSRFKQ